MKKSKIFTGIIVAGLAISMPLTSMAATWDDVDAWSKLEKVFLEDKDENVEINMTGDIQCEGELSSGQGQSYVINGNGNTLTNVSIAGSGQVEINADLTGTADSEAALYVYEEAQVALNGDVKSEDDGVEASDKAIVEVKGDIVAESDGIVAYNDSKVTMTGDIITKYNDGIDTDNNSQVTLTGDVTAKEDDGILADENSTVVVNGNVSGKDVGINANDSSKVVVNGDVSGMDGNAPDGDGNLDNATMNDPDGYSDGGFGIEASESAVVTVNGNVSGGDAYGTFGYAGDGIWAYGESQIIVTGDVTGGNQIANPEVPDEGTNGQAGDGIAMYSTASVTVKGNVTGGNATGQGAYGGSAVSLSLAEEEEGVEAGTLYIEGKVTAGESTGKDGKEGSIIYSGVEYNAIYEISKEAEYSDFSEDEQLMEFLNWEGSNNLYMAGSENPDKVEDVIAWMNENYWDKLDSVYEEAVGKSFTDIASTGGSNAPAKLIEEIEKLNLTDQEYDALMKALLDVYNESSKALYEQIGKEAPTHIVPEITVDKTKLADGAELITFYNGKEYKLALEDNITYIVDEEASKDNTTEEAPKDNINNSTEGPKTGDSPMVGIVAAMASISAFAMLLLRRKLKTHEEV